MNPGDVPSTTTPDQSKNPDAQRSTRSRLHHVSPISICPVADSTSRESSIIRVARGRSAQKTKWVCPSHKPKNAGEVLLILRSFIGRRVTSDHLQGYDSAVGRGAESIGGGPAGFTGRCRWSVVHRTQLFQTAINRPWVWFSGAGWLATATALECTGPAPRRRNAPQLTALLLCRCRNAEGH